MPEDLEEFGPKAERLKLLEELRGLNVNGYFYNPDKIEYYPGSDTRFRIIFSELLTRYRDKIGGEVFLETLRMAISDAVKKFFSQ